MESDNLVPGDLRTARVYQSIGDSIFSYIKLTIDCPSLHTDGWMPCLDLKLRLREIERVTIIEHTHYRKPVCDSRLILNSSAHPDKVKRLTAVSEGPRNLLNTSSSLDWTHRAELLTELAARLKNSGYEEVFRGQVVRDCVVGWERKVEVAEAGGRPLYRPRWWQREDRNRRKLLKKTAWHRPESDVVAYFPATPQAELLKGIQKVVGEESSRLGVKVKVLERGGVPLNVQLFRPEARQAQCGAPDCYLDKGQSRGGHHHKAGALYRGTCNLCKQQGISAEYTGETGFSGYTRTLCHQRDIRKDRPASSALADHVKQHHPEAVGREETCSVKVLRTYSRPLDRQIAEAVNINRSRADILINRKDEWLPPVTYRLQPTQELRQGHPSAGNRGRGRNNRNRGGGTRA